MLSELPKLFERHFAIGYLLPSVLFFAANFLLFGKYSILSDVRDFFTGNPLLATTLAMIAAWIFGIFLLVLNRELYRFLEGYGAYNPVKLLGKLQKRVFDNKISELEKLKESKRQNPDKDDKLELLVNKLAQEYPPEGNDLLPTPFGNAIQAFEIYPQYMYGIEGIDGWARLQAVIPIEYRILVNDAKAQVDWWVNLSAISFFILIEFYVLTFLEWGFSPGIIKTMLNICVPLFIFGLLNYFVQWRAVSAVVSWGDYIKSSFDLYRYKLLELLGIGMPEDRDQEKELWLSFSQAIVFHMPEALPPIRVKKSDSDIRKHLSEEDYLQRNKDL